MFMPTRSSKEFFNGFPSLFLLNCPNSSQYIRWGFLFSFYSHPFGSEKNSEHHWDDVFLLQTSDQSNHHISLVPVIASQLKVHFVNSIAHPKSHHSTMTMRKVVVLLLLCNLLQLQEGRAFTLPILRVVSSARLTAAWYSDPTSSVASSASSFESVSPLLPVDLESHDDYINDLDDNLFFSSRSTSTLLPRKRGIRGFFYNRFAGFVTGLVGFVTQGIAAVDEYEYAELPPP
jgi:hypothetical protein